jgi:hypothetical protein
MNVDFSEEVCTAACIIVFHTCAMRVHCRVVRRSKYCIFLYMLRHLMRIRFFRCWFFSVAVNIANSYKHLAINDALSAMYLAV